MGERLRRHGKDDDPGTLEEKFWLCHSPKSGDERERKVIDRVGNAGCCVAEPVGSGREGGEREHQGDAELSALLGTSTPESDETEAYRDDV